MSYIAVGELFEKIALPQGGLFFSAVLRILELGRFRGVYNRKLDIVGTSAEV